MMRARVLAIGTLVLIVTAVSPVAPGRADTVEPMNPGPGQTVDKEYPMIVGQDPQEASSTALGDSHSAPTPDNCATLPSCNVIPLTFQVPKGFDKRDTYVATISLYFERAQAVDTHTAGLVVATADYDLYLWAEAFNEPECKSPKAGTDPPDYCTTDLALSAGSVMPEIIKVDVSSRQKFLLEVSNSGSAVPYRVHIESTYFKYDAPIESLGSSFSPTTGQSTSGPALSLPSLSPGGGPGTSAPSSSDVDTSLAALSPTGDSSGLDSDVTGINGDSLSSIINSGPLLKTAAKTNPAGPPSNSSLVFWMVLVPLVLGAAATTLFLRRRPRALRI